MKNNSATISADIVSSTALSVGDRLFLEKKMLELLTILEQFFGTEQFYGRLIKGDYIECVLPEPKFALRAALIIKSFVKSLQLSQTENSRHKALLDIRVAVGVGEMRIFDREKGIIDGEAIYLSGRAINELSGKKNKTFVFRTNNAEYKVFESIFGLLDVLFASFTRIKSEIVFHKLLDKLEKDIVFIRKKKQQTINMQTNSARWWAIDDTVKTFEAIIK